MPIVKEAQQQEFAGLTPRDLLTESGYVLNHPVLRAIVETDHLPNACDEWVRKLGYPNSVARMIRAAAELRRQNFTREEWNRYKATSVRPVEVIAKIPPRMPNEMVPITCCLFGNTQDDRQEIPYFLRDFLFTLQDPKCYLSTLDGDGREFPTTQRVRDDVDPVWDFFTAVDNHTLSYPIDNGHCHFRKGQCFFSFKGCKVFTKTSLVDPPLKRNRFPRLVKSLQIEGTPNRSDNFRERIRAFLYSDFKFSALSSETKVGELTYERFSGLNWQWSMLLQLRYTIVRTALGLSAILETAGFHEGLLKVVPVAASYEDELVHLHSLDSRVLPRLAELGEHMANSNPPNLHKVLGIGFLPNTSEQLASFFL